MIFKCDNLRRSGCLGSMIFNCDNLRRSGSGTRTSVTSKSFGDFSTAEKPACMNLHILKSSKIGSCILE